jgi:RNA polymerase sigma-70 factor (ECF subfamily)
MEIVASTTRGAPGVLPGFRRRTTLDETAEHDGTVARAVVRARQGDREAVRYLYVRYADNVYGYVNSIVQDQHEAEDLTQNVFAKLMVVLPRYEPRDVPFFAWILRVARNIALDHVRQRRAIPFEDVREDEDSHDADMGRNDVDSERLSTLKAALATLPEEQREVVFLRHVAGLSPGEIADRLGKTESSVHGLHHRGRRSLQRSLAGVDAGPTALAVQSA